MRQRVEVLSIQNNAELTKLLYQDSNSTYSSRVTCILYPNRSVARKAKIDQESLMYGRCMICTVKGPPRVTDATGAPLG